MLMIKKEMRKNEKKDRVMTEDRPDQMEVMSFR